MSKFEFCSTCVPLEYCQLKGYIKASLEWMPPEQVEQLFISSDSQKCVHKEDIHLLIRNDNKIETPHKEETKTIDHLTEPLKNELIHTNYAKWLSGVFAAGGAIGFIVKKQKDKMYCSPRLEISLSDPLRAPLFFPAFRERLTAITQEEDPISKALPSFMSLKTEHIGLIVEAIKPFSPSHNLVIDLIEKWTKANMLESALARQREKERIAHKYVDQPVVIPYNISDNYSDLLSHPFFLAGVLDIRGSFSESSGRIRLKVHSTNKALIEAISIRHNQKYYSTSKNSYMVRFEGQKLLEVLEEVRGTSEVLFPLARSMNKLEIS